MKTIATKLILFLSISLLLGSCNIDMINRVEGNKNVTTTTRKVGDDFTRVKVSRGLDLYITQGSNSELTVEADENLQDLIKTEVKNGQLNIYSEKNIWRAKSKKIYLTLPQIDYLKASSGSEVVSKGTLNVNDFEVDVSSGADVNLTVKAKNVVSEASSGSYLNIKGETETHNAKASSGASIRAYKLESETTTARVSSGANIDVHASEYLDAKASSGGDIDYRGNPKRINKKTSSGGSVSS